MNRMTSKSNSCDGVSQMGKVWSKGAELQAGGTPAKSLGEPDWSVMNNNNTLYTQITQ